ncbi:efflux RND transporter periplasmic adaptor subunit [Methylosinus sp. H3A]|uniref:efflux RND transporter periplasmic adaptor subunit n=1 Tax=Methylosinus sp. H3A TaxID=2785786 RepID=UPI0018C20D91|nr:efflux RND transporter periplasmic adaptor subunit [Methylosinus sp. H3A]MBG0811182.1 efflux RND transporter periplasmic adaptor subunit [Methylosinus sp. H3A]
MPPFAPLFGALALAASVTASVLHASHSDAARSDHPTAVAALDDPILFYRDPMGGAEVSRHPRKDGMGMDFLPVRRSRIAPFVGKLPDPPAASREEPLFYRDPMGGDDISAGPRKDGMGMDYLPVRPVDLRAVLPELSAKPRAKRILYYRNPMGLPDVSPAPKKDAMGMDYTPVYEGEDVEADGAVRIAPGKIQRTGVRSELVRRRPLIAKIRVPGAVQVDERRVAVVATRSEAFVEKVAEATTGARVSKGQPLVRLYSPAIAAAAADYLVFANSRSGGDAGLIDGLRRKLETLNAPPEFIAEIARSRRVPASVSWPAPREGVILERNAVDGMKAEAGQVLFRIADLSVVWALVDVAEQDYARLRVGQAVEIRARGLPDRVFAGHVTVVYPQINRETRTARVRIELPNADLILRPDMYVEAEILAGDAEQIVTAPESAVIETGKRALVLLDKGEGRFEPREVTLGRRGEGFVEVRSGLDETDRVVTAANFLIDSESNLRAALQTLAGAEATR